MEFLGFKIFNKKSVDSEYINIKNILIKNNYK